MKRIFKLIRNIFSLLLFKIAHPRTEVIYIESNIFGHAILEAEIAYQQVLTRPNSKYVLATHHQSANLELTKQILSIFLQNRDIRHSKTANYAIQGQDFLRNRLRIKGNLKVLNYQSELTHETASNLGHQYPKLLEVVNINIGDIPAEYRNCLLVMNRSDAYSKYQEDSDLHRYRNFSFEPLEEALSNSQDVSQYARIGYLDNRSKTRVIRDLRDKVTENPELDLAVQVTSKGYFGADSGPCWAALVLDKPVGFVNMIPLNQPCPTDPKKLIVIFKPLYYTQEKRVLSMTEMVSPFISNLRSTSDYVRASLEPVENNREDISACLEDFTNLLTDPLKSDYDFEKMRWIRDKLNVRTLPSISTRYLMMHPEIKV